MRDPIVSEALWLRFQSQTTSFEFRALRGDVTVPHRLGDRPGWSFFEWHEREGVETLRARVDERLRLESAHGDGHGANRRARLSDALRAAHRIVSRQSIARAGRPVSVEPRLEPVLHAMGEARVRFAKEAMTTAELAESPVSAALLTTLRRERDRLERREAPAIVQARRHVANRAEAADLSEAERRQIVAEMEAVERHEREGRGFAADTARYVVAAQAALASHAADKSDRPGGNPGILAAAPAIERLEEMFDHRDLARTFLICAAVLPWQPGPL